MICKLIRYSHPSFLHISTDKFRILTISNFTSLQFIPNLFLYYRSAVLEFFIKGSHATLARRT